MSPRNVARPRPLPPERRTLVAPMLPLPTERTSCLRKRWTSRHLTGIEPSKYATAMTSRPTRSMTKVSLTGPSTEGQMTFVQHLAPSVGQTALARLREFLVSHTLRKRKRMMGHPDCTTDCGIFFATGKEVTHVYLRPPSNAGIKTSLKGERS